MENYFIALEDRQNYIIACGRCGRLLHAKQLGSYEDGWITCKHCGVTLSNPKNSPEYMEKRGNFYALMVSKYNWPYKPPTSSMTRMAWRDACQAWDREWEAQKIDVQHGKSTGMVNYKTIMSFLSLFQLSKDKVKLVPSAEYTNYKMLADMSPAKMWVTTPEEIATKYNSIRSVHAAARFSYWLTKENFDQIIICMGDANPSVITY